MSTVLVPELEFLKQSDQTSIHVVCFVCTGNTCRSPMAAGIFNSKYSNIGKAISAGLFASGDSISTNAKEVLHEHGITSEDFHRSTQISSPILEMADEIYGISVSHQQQLLLSFPEFASKIHVLPMNIPDPFGGDLDIYRSTYLKIENSLDLLWGKKK